MQILVVESGKSPVITEIDGSLKEMQKIVGGTIQAIYPFPDEVALICNDEGRTLGLPLNRGLRDEHGNLYDIISGTFFLCGTPSDSGRLASLTEAQLEHFQKHFQKSEVLTHMGNRIICLPMQNLVKICLA